MTRVYDQTLHQIWNRVLTDDAVPAHSIIIESMSRARSDGFKECAKVLAELEQMASASQNYVPGPLGQRLAKTIKRARAALT